MKKWMFVIYPGIALGLFIILYSSETAKMEEKERAHIADVAQAKKADDDRKARLQQEANESQAKKAKERAEETAKKEADKAAKWKAEGDKIQDETNKARAEASASAKKITELEAEIARLRSQRDKSNLEYLGVIKSVELAKIERRKAEIEIQRTTQMVAMKAADSSLTRIPPPVAPPPPAR